MYRKQLCSDNCINGFGKREFLNGAMIASAKLDVTANTSAEEVEAEWVSVVAARRGLTCPSLVLKRLVLRSLMELVRFTWERAGSSWGTRRTGASKVAQLHRASILAPSGFRAAPRYHVADTTVRSEKQMLHVMAHLDICQTGEMPWAEKMKIFLLPGGSIQDRQTPERSQLNRRSFIGNWPNDQGSADGRHRQESG